MSLQRLSFAGMRIGIDCSPEELKARPERRRPASIAPMQAAKQPSQATSEPTSRSDALREDVKAESRLRVVQNHAAD
eukprot:CAMPEP_0171569896 /NCGR_PEP_ID=MMETSP0961-20121227/2624_1 /TAXON_ID=87120 /ORGANISM="Aurantiochytrium limacinum, Strain ATCCMYA-1381" /LENGTH=76 /DNA_ID=CAMNT_0012124287 /DNA_START=370 /DNA_END=600 /DNA_ORIENTATION=+